jgi:hypothetical protein
MGDGHIERDHVSRVTAEAIRQTLLLEIKKRRVDHGAFI